ncbi:hypothetical protein [Pseudooctadecabacter jejudonensis]|uniref:Uncharacterized protein n=1 Tax=Pseudooctadecabacter jejudonensis TaxID=1391910 RepID=A0A1Y5RP68_9RHOB|nr:hypothetical protein [Pseudooctadecabacter jejudonensis]SLN22231.1 hypothetical protein PSJ8397_00885 [Pseudooctadecabacter jejudonensis]
MKCIILSIAMALFAAPATAETPLSAEAFEALVEGKTLSFSVGGAPYGSEFYGPNRQVIWSFVNGTCQYGEWFERPTDQGPSICFVYEGDGQEQCWQVFEDAGTLRAEFLNAPNTTVLYQLEEAAPLVCGGVGT